MSRQIFVFGADLAPGGNELGKISQARLAAGLAIWRNGGGEFVFAMGYSHRPEYRGNKSGAGLMAEWVHRELPGQLVTVHILTPEHGLFNTVGEAGALFHHLCDSSEKRVVIVSSRYHLPRVRLVIKRRFGRRYLDCQFEWHTAEADPATPIKVVLELIKLPYLFIPDGLIKKWFFTTFNRYLGNSSWR